jgi:hypothetical protein
MGTRWVLVGCTRLWTQVMGTREDHEVARSVAVAEELESSIYLP